MRMLNILFGCVLISFLFTGCTARSLSVLQAEYNATVRAEDDCDKKPTAFTPDAACSVDFKAVFKNIADQAESSISQRKGGGDLMISFHRLRAYALWRSGAAEKEIVAAARKGLDKCAQDKSMAVPRDCALLSTIGYHSAIEGTKAQIAAINSTLKPVMDDAAKLTTVCKQNAEQWGDDMQNGWRNTYLPYSMKVSEIVSREEIDVSLKQYLGKQHQNVLKQTNAYEIAIRKCIPAEKDKALAADCPCDPNRRKGEHKAACDQVYHPDNPVLSMYHKVTCINEDKFQTTTCPCGYGEKTLTEREQKNACEYVESVQDLKMLHFLNCQLKE